MTKVFLGFSKEVMRIPWACEIKSHFCKGSLLWPGPLEVQGSFLAGTLLVILDKPSYALESNPDIHNYHLLCVYQHCTAASLPSAPWKLYCSALHSTPPVLRSLLQGCHISLRSRHL